MTDRPILFSAPIYGYEGRYTITNDGMVVNIERNAPVAVAINNCGYSTVLLRFCGKTKRHLIHRLVAAAFIPNPNAKKFVNHKDGNKSNNADSNLEWVTQSENERHAFSTGLKKPLRGIPLSDETKAKISSATKGRSSPCGFSGKKRSPESIAKFQASMAARRTNHA